MANLSSVFASGKDILDIFYPRQCFVCEASLEKDKILCNKCRAKLELMEIGTCLICQENPAGKGICENCKEDYPFKTIVSGFKFNSVVQKLLHNFKYNEFRKIGVFLTELMHKRLKENSLISHADYIIPIPLHKVKKRDRGFNQSKIIARNLSVSLDIPVIDKLKRVKYTKTQTKLTRKERDENVSEAFFVKQNRRIIDKNIILVDDVLTTGSTLKHAANALLKGGANNIFAVTIARA